MSPIRNVCFLFFCVCQAMLACSKASSEGEEAVGPAAGSELVGAWQTSCMNDKDGSARGYADVDGGTLTMSNRDFGLTNCRAGDQFNEYRSTYGIIALLEPGEIEGWTTAKVTVRSHSLVYFSQEAADWANNASWFGYTDWAVNVPKDIAGRKSKASDDSRTPRSRVGETRYFTMTVEEGKLRLANYQNGQALRSDDPWDVMERR